MIISIEQATQLVFAQTVDFGTEQVPLSAALDRILKEDLTTDRPLPPYNRVTMDGIAIAFAAFEQGQRRFKIEGTQAAGEPPLTLTDPQHCLEIMTGASLSNGTDTVVRYEDVEINDGYATITEEAIRNGQNIHLKGEDRAEGELVAAKNQRISPSEIGLAAAIGKTTLRVAKQPCAVVISTGDELVRIENTPLPHQIRESNTPSIAAILERSGVHSVRLHIADDEAVTYDTLSKCVEKFKVIVLTGGVSKGKFDFVPKALKELGVEQIFHQVAQRPGKPFWFGRHTRTGAVVFALPGNPVSTFMCTHRYILPWFRHQVGLPPFEPKFAVLNEDFRFQPPLQYFLQVKLTADPPTGRLLATPLAGKGSGDFANLVDADAFMELPAEKTHFAKGEVYPIWTYR